VRAQTLKAAHEAGYVIPPSSMNPQSPGTVNRVLEGAGAGKIQTQQYFSLKNQPVTNAAVARDLGLPPDKALSTGLLEKMRSAAARAGYDPLKNLEIQVDSQVGSDFGKTLGEYGQVRGIAPKMKVTAIEDIYDTLAGLDGKTITGEGALSLIRNWRYNGFANINSQNPVESATGKAQLAAANALEGLIDRHLEQTGQSGALGAYRAARELIAKTFTAQNALQEGTGDIAAQVIGKEFARAPQKFSGGMADIGRVWELNRKAMQLPSNMGSVPGLSPLDTAVATITGGTAEGSKAGFAGIPFVRPVVRSLLASKPYQAYALARATPPTATGMFGAELSGPQKALMRELLLRSSVAAGGGLGGLFALQ
jgi:hypothetical protein